MIVCMNEKFRASNGIRVDLEGLAPIGHDESRYHELGKGKYLSDFVYGANDGVITTFAIVTGAVGASLSPGVIVILGVANLLADGFSMGSSNFLSLKSQKNFNRVQRAKEEAEVEHVPEVERQEVRDILRSWNIPEAYIEGSTDAITSDKKRWIDFMMREELNIVEDPDDHQFRHGLVTFFAFVVAGSIPLIPFIFSFPPNVQLWASVFAAGIALFVVGAAQSLVTKKEWWWRLGLQVFLVGGFAAAIAYFVGWFLKTSFGILV